MTYYMDIIILTGHIKVIDFGLAKWLKKSQKTSTICGTLQYIGKWLG